MFFASTQCEFIRQAMKILKTLKRYVKAVQKDRLHTVKRYKHLRETDPAEAEQLRQHMAEHLRKVDGQLTMALGMLDRVPAYKKKVEIQISMHCYYYNASLLLLKINIALGVLLCTALFVVYHFTKLFSSVYLICLFLPIFHRLLRSMMIMLGVDQLVQQTLLWTPQRVG